MKNRMLNRRRFLEMTVGTLAGASLAAPPAQAAGAPPQVLIIGAGMSGVSTSYFLRKLGISSLILEARDRIGGRLWSSTRWPDAIVDLGGAWIHNSAFNPLTPLTKQFNIQTVFSNYALTEFRTPNGNNLTATDTALALQMFATAEANVNAAAGALQSRGFPDRPYGTELDKALAAIQPQVTPPVFGAVQTLVDLNIRGLGGEPSDESLYYFGQDLRVLGALDLAFPKGYAQIVQRLALGQQILYNQVAKQIQYGPQGVTVVTNQGNYSAKYAVSTLPIGVLKSGSVQFVPALPAWKQGAINRLHTGVINKLVLRFPKVFWDTSLTFFLRTQPPTDRYVWWLNLVPITGQPVLACFVTADAAVQTESLSDTEVVNQLMAVLRAWVPNKTLPNPVDFQRTRWLADPFAVGAYPHIPVGATPTDFDLTGLPVPYAANLPASANRLFFAGDGTTSDHPSEAWGAYESGQRVAGSIQIAMTTK